MKGGTYCLILRLPQARHIAVGRRDPLRFPAGWYCYAGSALGGLAARIARHQRQDKRLRWHIDYLLQHARIKEVVTIQSAERLECELSRRIAALGQEPPLPGFGASDCKCQSHLHYFPQDPTASIREIARGLTPTESGPR